MQRACPGVDVEDAIDILSFSDCDEIVDAVEKTGIMMLDYRAHEGLCEGIWQFSAVVRKKARNSDVVSIAGGWITA
jgi:uncharacterized protein Yka (UPF0111/DUF47 family)